MDSNRIREVLETMDNILTADYIPQHLNVYMSLDQVLAVRRVLQDKIEEEYIQIANRYQDGEI